nr:hypothetical protein [Tanacetum cinerariifolium]
MKDQHLPADASPTALSPGYIANFDPEEDEEDPADYPADGGDNDDNESSNDDDDDDDMIMSPQAEDAEACSIEFAATLLSSLPPPPENIKSLKDNIRGYHLES